MILAIDCGNSRVKWGLCAALGGAGPAPIEWIVQGAADIDQLAQLRDRWRMPTDPGTIIIANVAGQGAAGELAKSLKNFAALPRWITPGVGQCGVSNHYVDPARLGPDRWAALIAARAMHAGDSLVVMAGTATTIDVLSANGDFRGGLILPGERLMKRALAEYTAALPLAAGAITEFPRDTEDAIETGCFFAQLGAIERMYASLSNDRLCLLSGGAASRFAGHLNIPLRVVDNLVLEGLARMARDESGSELI